MFKIIKVVDGKKENIQDKIIVEYFCSIYINGKEFASIMCTPTSLYYLIVGFLFSEGVINSIKDIITCDVDEKNSTVRVTTNENDVFSFKGDNIEAKKIITSACGKNRSISYYLIGLSATNDLIINSNIIYSEKDILKLANEFNKSSDLFLSTGGVHSCALADKNGVILFEEDIGRHNALDKIIGRALCDDINFSDKILFTTGRISSEMATKVIKAKIPFLVSRSASTDKAIDLAKKYNLTLIGFARANKMNIYANSQRIGFN